MNCSIITSMLSISSGMTCRISFSITGRYFWYDVVIASAPSELVDKSSCSVVSEIWLSSSDSDPSTSSSDSASTSTSSSFDSDSSSDSDSNSSSTSSSDSDSSSSSDSATSTSFFISTLSSSLSVSVAFWEFSSTPMLNSGNLLWLSTSNFDPTKFFSASTGGSRSSRTTFSLVSSHSISSIASSSTSSCTDISISSSLASSYSSILNDSWKSSLFFWLDSPVSAPRFSSSSSSLPISTSSKLSESSSLSYGKLSPSFVDPMSSLLVPFSRIQSWIPISFDTYSVDEAGTFGIALKECIGKSSTALSPLSSTSSPSGPTLLSLSSFILKVKFGFT